MVMDDILQYLNNFEKVIKTLRIGIIVDIIVLVVITVVVFKLIKISAAKLSEKLEEQKSPVVRFMPLFARILKGLVLFFLIATFLQSHGYSMTSLIAGFGVTGLAVGFAAKETISNVFGAISILSDKSYRIGDYVVIDGVEGTVEDINMRSTKIRGTDDTIHIVPNSLAASAVIKNFSGIKRRRIIEVIGITRETSNEKLRRAVDIIKEILKNYERISSDYYVYIEKLDQSSVNIKLSAYTKTKDFAKFVRIREDIILEIIEKFRAESIEFSLPSTSVYVEKK